MATAAPPPPPDPDVPALATLLGSDADELLTAVARSLGGTVRTIERTQVSLVPGRSVTVQFRLDVNWRSEGNRRETFVATSGIDVPDGVPVFSAGDADIALWRFPSDPLLPGLPVVNDRERLGALLHQVGIEEETVRTRRRSYRPGRRAVFEVATPNNRVFVKVVRPQRVAELQRIHTAMAAQIPVPMSHGWNAEQGIVVLQAMPGRTLRRALEAGSRKLPTGGAVVALLEKLPRLEPATAVSGPRRRVRSHAKLLQALVPNLADRIAAVVGAVERDAGEPAEAVHGDFHSSQLLVRGTTLVGLIDVDTAGVGSRSDDLGMLLAHLAALSLTTPGRRTVERYGSELITEFDRLVDPRALRLTVAAAVLGFATGPFRVQQSTWPAQTERRIALAEQWTASAAAL